MALPIPIRARGSHFYKYATTEHLERLKLIILEHELFFATLGQMHDPADGKPKLASTSREQLAAVLHKYYILEHPGLSNASQERAATEIRELVQREKPQDLLREIAQKLHAHSDRYRVYCLSKRWDNLGMWAKFAGGHSGYCLEFANDGPFASACEVAYGDAPPLMDITDPNDRGPYCFFKRQEFAGEEEVRVTLPPGSGPIVKIEPHCLSRVILGTHMSKADQRQIREWVTLREPGLTVVTAYFDELDQVIKLRE